MRRFWIKLITVIKITFEYLRNLATQQLERTDRLKRLQETLNAKGMTDDEKQDRLKEHASKETEFLRLRRSKLGADDFEPLKVIGKGAFGEVRLVSCQISGISASFSIIISYNPQ